MHSMLSPPPSAHLAPGGRPRAAGRSKWQCGVHSSPIHSDKPLSHFLIGLRLRRCPVGYGSCVIPFSTYALRLGAPGKWWYSEPSHVLREWLSDGRRGSHCTPTGARPLYKLSLRAASGDPPQREPKVNVLSHGVPGIDSTVLKRTAAGPRSAQHILTDTAFQNRHSSCRRWDQVPIGRFIGCRAAAVRDLAGCDLTSSQALSYVAGTAIPVRFAPTWEFRAHNRFVADSRTDPRPSPRCP